MIKIEIGKYYLTKAGLLVFAESLDFATGQFRMKYKRFSIHPDTSYFCVYADGQYIPNCPSLQDIRNIVLELPIQIGDTVKCISTEDGRELNRIGRMYKVRNINQHNDGFKTIKIKTDETISEWPTWHHIEEFAKVEKTNNSEIVIMDELHLNFKDATENQKDFCSAFKKAIMERGQKQHDIRQLQLQKQVQN